MDSRADARPDDLTLDFLVTDTDETGGLGLVVFERRFIPGLPPVVVGRAPPDRGPVDKGRLVTRGLLLWRGVVER